MRKQITSIVLTALITATIVGGATYLFLLQTNRFSPAIPTPQTSELSAIKPTETDTPFNEHSYYEDELEARIMADGIKYATVESLSYNNLDILYGDITGDAQEEAVVAIPSGGTAGNLGVLIYSVVNKKVSLIDEIKGYKIWPSIQDKQLIAQTPYYLETDADCCPSFFDITTYAWNGTKFVVSKTKRMTFNELNQK